MVPKCLEKHSVLTEFPLIVLDGLIDLVGGLIGLWLGGQNSPGVVVRTARPGG